LFKKSAFDHEVDQGAIRHRILNSAGPKQMLTKSCFLRKHFRCSRTNTYAPLLRL